MKYKFKIKGIDCANCAQELERKIKKVDGIKDASISFITEKMILEIDDKKDEIMEKVKKVIKKEEPDVTVIEA